MIVLEAASGRHPFDGLTEQVMNHQLATRPIDVRGVYDDELRQLCRGLLLRDPKRRWGRDEVSRWLAGDASLVIPDDAEGAATSVRPVPVRQDRGDHRRGARARAREALGRRAPRPAARPDRALARAGAARLQPAAHAARHPGDEGPHRRRAAVALPARGRARPAAGVEGLAGDDGFGHRRGPRRRQRRRDRARLARLAVARRRAASASRTRATRRFARSIGDGARRGSRSPRCGRARSARRKSGGRRRATSAAVRTP